MQRLPNHDRTKCEEIKYARCIAARSLTVAVRKRPLPGEFRSFAVKSEPRPLGSGHVTTAAMRSSMIAGGAKKYIEAMAA